MTIMEKSIMKSFKKIVEVLKNILLCETPEEKLYKDEWNRRLDEIIKKMKK